MTLNEFMRANKMTFADVEEELNKFKAAEAEKQKAEKKEQLTKNIIKDFIEYAALFDGEVPPEEEKEMLVELLCPVLGPIFEKKARETANNIKSSKTVPDFTDLMIPQKKRAATEKDLEDILNILSL